MVAAAPAGAQSPAGRYKGDWQGTAAGGGITLALEAAAEGKWSCQVSFTLGDQEVKTKVTYVRVEGGKMEARYEFDLGGARLESTITGELRGGRIEGGYRTKALADGSPVDEGTWKATREAR